MQSVAKVIPGRGVGGGGGRPKDKLVWSIVHAV